MKIGFVGAGKVGVTLGKYFVGHGQDVTGFYSRSNTSAKEAAAFTGTACFGTLNSVLAASDILFLTVPDAAISDLWRQLKALPLQNKIICHCSGLLSSADFDGINERGAYGYSIHPLFAISSKTESYKTIGQAIFTIEGHEKYLLYFKEFFERMGIKVSIITAQQKVKYHAAAVFLSNHVAALAQIGCQLLQECGFDEAFSKTVLNTLFLSNCKAIAENGAIASLTGPVERNDLMTIKKHIGGLENNEKSIYILLSRCLATMAKEKHREIDYAEIAAFLSNIQEVRQ
jgi:predicted short-subunit dehydrogenase-like oxidoreductase (DUF2520 family)